MSGFYLLVLLAIWLFVGWWIYDVWKKYKPSVPKRKILHILIGVILFTIWFGGPFWQFAGKKMYWDAKVREWCAKDGGVKVYETVVLPAGQYDEYVKRRWPFREKSRANPSDKYFYVDKTFYYHRENPRVTRTLTQIVRRSDGKVLGEKVRYGRGGGDLPGFGHPSSYSCYDITKKPSNFEISIFIKGDE